MLPKLGAANMPYARSVRPRTLQPATLPEPEVLFDSIMVRKKFEEHPNKISSVMFYLASIIIHGTLAKPVLCSHHPSDSPLCQICFALIIMTSTIL